MKVESKHENPIGVKATQFLSQASDGVYGIAVESGTGNAKAIILGDFKSYVDNEFDMWAQDVLYYVKTMVSSQVFSGSSHSSGHIQPRYRVQGCGIYSYYHFLKSQSFPSSPLENGSTSMKVSWTLVSVQNAWTVTVNITPTTDSVCGQSNSTLQVFTLHNTGSQSPPSAAHLHSVWMCCAR